MRSLGKTIALVTVSLLGACGEPAAPVHTLAPPALPAPSASTSASTTKGAAKPAAASTDDAAIAKLGEARATSLAGVWLRRLAVAYRASNDPASPEVRRAASELAFAVEWVSLAERKNVLAGAAVLAPVFEEHSRPPVPSRLTPQGEPPQDYRAAKAADTAALLPQVVALYTKLGAGGRRSMLFALDDAGTIDALFAVSARDGTCPAIRDDRDLSWRAFRAPSAAACLPPALPADELTDVERLSAELSGPWPRAVRAIAALRDVRDRTRARFAPTLAQQRHFVAGCTKHPMCPLWLLDKPDPALRPALEEAKKTAPPQKKADLDRALAKITGVDASAPAPAEAEREATACVDALAKDLASPGEPWVRDARASARRRECLSSPSAVPKNALAALLPKADPDTAVTLVEALLAADKRAKLPPDELARLAADVRTRIGLYRALASAKREGEMPAAMKKHELLLESEAGNAIVTHYGQWPTSLARKERSKLVVEKRPVTFELFEASSGGEYEAVPPIAIAVGPFHANAPYAPFHESGTDWGTEAHGLRALVEQHFADPRSVDFFDSYR